jgi:hypothetical protein
VGRRLLVTVGVALGVIAAAAVGVAAIIGVGLLFWLGAKSLVVVVWHAIVEGIKDSLNGKS